MCFITILSVFMPVEYLLYNLLMNKVCISKFQIELQLICIDFTDCLKLPENIKLVFKVGS